MKHLLAPLRFSTLCACAAIALAVPTLLHAQDKKVMLLFVQYSDHATNPLARGGRGWIDTNQNGIPDIAVDHKYRWKDYRNIYFDTAHAPHRDSIDYFGVEIGAGARVGFKMEMLTGVRGYYREVSSRLSDIIPADDFLDTTAHSPRIAGLWNFLVHNGSNAPKDTALCPG